MSKKNPKEYIVNCEEYIASLPIIDNISTRLKFSNKEYILFVKLNESGNGICFILTEGYIDFFYFFL